MDLTQEYIKICEKAKKIQELWEPKEGDFFLIDGLVQVITYERKGRYQPFDRTPIYRSDKHGIYYRYLDDEVRSVVKDFKNIVFIPRQDQLQGIIKDKTTNENNEDLFILMLRDFTLTQYATKVNGSMEQLTLGFVMKEKFNKTWNGMDWE